MHGKIEFMKRCSLKTLKWGDKMVHGGRNVSFQNTRKSHTSTGSVPDASGISQTVDKIPNFVILTL
jgi:hypothetical protein